MSHYKSGKIPKAFKLIPSLKNWEQVLLLTKPDSWSSHAMSAAVHLLSATLDERQSTRFYRHCLLTRFRHDVEKHRKLNVHLFNALKRAVYKPAAFFRGLVIPLAQDAMTARESIIMCSILAKVSLPSVHSAVALMKLCEMEYSGPVALMIRTLINKKYNLPFKFVIFHSNLQS